MDYDDMLIKNIDEKMLRRVFRGLCGELQQCAMRVEARTHAVLPNTTWREQMEQENRSPSEIDHSRSRLSTIGDSNGVRAGLHAQARELTDALPELTKEELEAIRKYDLAKE
jgi:hypothetical protein